MDPEQPSVSHHACPATRRSEKRVQAASPNAIVVASLICLRRASQLIAGRMASVRNGDSTSAERPSGLISHSPTGCEVA